MDQISKMIPSTRTPETDRSGIRIGTEKVNHTSESVNYGKPMELDYYTVRCLKCKKDCVTANVIDGEEKYGTIQQPDVKLLFARCKSCDREWYF